MENSFFEVNDSESDSILKGSASCLVAIMFLPVAGSFESLKAGVGAIFVEFVEIEEVGS